LPTSSFFNDDRDLDARFTFFNKKINLKYYLKYRKKITFLNGCLLLFLMRNGVFSQSGSARLLSTCGDSIGESSQII
jgi:hypothetical protein